MKRRRPSSAQRSATAAPVSRRGRGRKPSRSRASSAITPRIPSRNLPRWNADPDDVQRSVVKLVLSLVEFLRQLMERQAIRRMEERTLSSEEIEAVGLALKRLEETVRQLAKQFGLDPSDLNLDLGPLGKLT
ncbi:MAG TPA: gas vesicle protein K [Vicinamibacterales bacterium]